MFFIDSQGDIVIADTDHHRIRRVNSQSGIISTIVGTGSFGLTGNGYFASSVETSPQGLAIDLHDNLFLADDSCVRKVDSKTNVITNIAGADCWPGGYGGDGGDALEAKLKFPEDLVVDSEGNIFIADTLNYRVRRVDSLNGEITTVLGNGLGGVLLNNGDGGLSVDAQISRPLGLSLDAQGNLYVSEPFFDRIRRIDGETKIVSTIAGTGTSGFSGDGGLALSAELDNPTYIDVDNEGNVFFADKNNHRIRRIDSQSGIITTVAGSGGTGYWEGGFSGDGGLATSARFNRPAGVAVDSAGNIVIADDGNNRVRLVSSETGFVTTIAGNGIFGNLGDGGLATNARIDVDDVDIDSENNIYISSGSRVRRVDPNTGVITTFVGSVDTVGMGPLSVAKLTDPAAIASANGQLWAAGGASGVLLKIDDDGVSSIVGRYPHFLATGNLARFRDEDFGSIGGVAVDDASGIAYIAETSNHRIHAIRMTDPDVPEEWTIEVLGGTGTAGFADGVLSGAQFSAPSGLLLVGNTLYVADTGNHVLRAIDLDSGVVETVAGSAQERGFFGDDGLATSALLFSPSAMASCPNGDMFIADTGNHRLRRLEASSGLLTTVLGDGVAASSGQGAPANTFPVSSPLGVACDDGGNVYATSTNSVRLLPADDDGIVDGTGPVQTIYGQSPRLVYPENVTRCLTGILANDKGVQFTDSCTGMLIELTQSAER